jgi:phage tail-like protein
MIINKISSFTQVAEEKIMPAGDRQDPYRNFRFRVEIDGIIQGGFSDVVFGSASTDVIEYREGNEPMVMRKLSGLTRYGNIQLRYGVTESKELWAWRKQVIDTGATGNRRTMSVVLMDEAGNDQARWDIWNAWPVRYDPPDFLAKDGKVAIEMIEIAHEGFLRKD